MLSTQLTIEPTHMTITHEQYGRMRHLAYRMFVKLFHHRPAKAGYYNANRDTEEALLKLFIWYYKTFRPSLWVK